MTKADIINKIAISTGIEKSIVLKTIEAYMEEMKTSMIKGKNVYLRGFGSFTVTKRAQKTARNISKNTEMIIPAHFIPKFKPAPEFTKEVTANNIVDKKDVVTSKIK